jgi:hypothetical protein
MALFGRRERPPSSLVAALDADERLLSWADTATGAVVAATSRGLRWPATDGPELIPWHLVNTVRWQSGTLTVTPARVVDDVFLEDLAPTSIRLTEARDLPPVIRKRVEGSIVGSELAAGAGGAVRFVARRVPGRDGPAWWARLEPGTPDTEPTRAAARARVERLRGGEHR